MQVLKLKKNLQSANTVNPGDTILVAQPKALFQDSVSKTAGAEKRLPGWKIMFEKLWHSTGIYDIIRQTSADPAHTWHLGAGRVLMMLVGIILIGLAIFKGFEPLLLLPIGFGAILANIPIAAIAGPDGLLGMVLRCRYQNRYFSVDYLHGCGGDDRLWPADCQPENSAAWSCRTVRYFHRPAWRPPADPVDPGYQFRPQRCCQYRYHWWSGRSNLNLSDK